MDFLTKAYPTIPLSSYSELVRRYLLQNSLDAGILWMVLTVNNLVSGTDAENFYPKNLYC